ncbi:hypothetical protein LOZ57_000354 [Ophidiomyces ophidiicola]|uniref:uncharacterized protein n=1 Tax=Ophidiomyces ophidiicola TaxID=1387563 RepID=UPI0020C51CB6|nr:uncharacterized protein LOZ57_000354 [Ophidiomyces ophidiicola]KAI1954010.1 hypothetical protein LOZ57_000354 [Ophidiomyces ophidiicola]KAI2058350.1 hypothetical protein LOZ43_002646 [Ophidiomyces ophidiicola]
MDAGGLLSMRLACLRLALPLTSRKNDTLVKFYTPIAHRTVFSRHRRLVPCNLVARSSTLAPEHTVECPKCHQSSGNNGIADDVSSAENQKALSTPPPQSLHIYEQRAANPGLPDRISNYLGPTHDVLDPMRLEFESNVGNLEHIGSKLIDDFRYQQDFHLWRVLLEYRQRHYGDEGVVHIWKGLNGRCAELGLPVEGDDADYLWKTFISIGLKQEWLMREIQLHGETIWKATRKRWHPFYEEVIGGYFKLHLPREALRWHLKLKEIHLERSNEVICILPHAMTTEHGVRGFRNICRSLEGHQIYSFVVPILWEKGMVGDALAMHEFLVSRRDGPKSLSEIEPLLRYVEMYGSEKQHNYFMQELVKAGLMDDTSIDAKQHQHHTPKAAKKSTKQPFRDDFGARLFATKSLTFELILGGFKMFGVDTIGPLTLREMALRTVNMKELVSQLAALQSSGISTGKSVFSKLVIKSVQDRNTALLRDILESDQHPDVFEDLETQKVLLAMYSRAGDWPQVHKTLAIMSMASDSRRERHDVLFRDVVRTGNAALIIQQLESMKEHGLCLSISTVESMAREILPARPSGYSPPRDSASMNDLRFLIWLYQQVIMSGGHVPPESWLECLKRLGMYNLWDELEKLCFWLVPIYGPPKKSTSEPIDGIKPPKAGTRKGSDLLEHLLPASHPRSPLRRIFGVQLQHAIVAWGFSMRPYDAENTIMLNPFGNEGEHLIPWARGIVLLRQLKDRGVIVQTNTIKSASRMRLAALFSDNRSSRRKYNRLLRKNNPWSLEELMQSIDQAWGKPVFSEYEGDLHRLVNPRPKVRHAPFRSRLPFQTPPVNFTNF